MAKEKKVVVTTSKKKKKVVPTTSKVKSSTRSTKAPEKLLFGKRNYLFMGIGVVLIALGMILMAGAEMAPDVWDESIIYGFRRLVIAPILILAGLIIQIYAIFKK